MYRTLLAFGIATSLLGGSAQADAPSVAVDIAPIHSLVARVMQGVGTPALIVPPGASPHEYSLRPSEANALQSADIVFWMGESLAPWLDGALDTLAADADIVTLPEIEGVHLLEMREDALFEAHAHDEEGEDKHHADGDHAAKEDDHENDDAATSDGAAAEHEDDEHGEEHDEHEDDDHGEENDEHEDDDHGEENDEHEDDDHGEEHAHEHGAFDPHAWLSPDNAKLWLDAIAAELSRLDADNAEAYADNATAARSELVELESTIEELLAPVRNMRFIVFHDAYQYFEEAFDLSAAGAISVSDASDPSPARVEQIRQRIREESIGCVLAEPQFNDSLVATVAEGMQTRTAVIDPIGTSLEPGPSLYPTLLRGMAESLNDCL